MTPIVSACKSPDAGQPSGFCPTQPLLNVTARDSKMTPRCSLLSPLVLGMVLNSWACSEDANQSPTGTGGGSGMGGAAGAFAQGGDAGVLAAAGGQSSVVCPTLIGKPGIMEERTIEVEGKQRRYALSVSASYTGTTAVPLVFGWHDLGGDGALVRGSFGLENAAARAAGDGVFVYPDGDPLATLSNRRGWDVAATSSDLAFFDAIFAAVQAEYCVDSRRIFSTGLGLGASFTYRLACSRPGVFRGIAPVGGQLPPDASAATCPAPIALIAIHGSADASVPVAAGEAARDVFAKLAGCGPTTQAVTPDPCVAYAGCSVSAPLVWCLHPGADTWPSFAAQGIWDFVAALQ